jgi:hypothetical protein
MYHSLENHFARNRWYSYVVWVKWKHILVHLEIVLVSTQDGCMVCAERTIGLESFWTHLIVLLGNMFQVEAHFNMFGYSFNLGTR